jgi:hypothetical protein
MKRAAAVFVALLAILAVNAAPAAADILSQPLYVNMRDSGPYRLGRYVNGQPSPAGALAVSKCGLWNPSAVTVGTITYLYAAECSGPYQGSGWYTIVRFTSRDGSLTFGSKVTVKRFASQIRTPTVVYDRGRFHLWYSQDRAGRLAQDLMYAGSVDGLHFTVPARKFTAAALNAVSVASVFRDSGAWWMLIEGYSADLKVAQPHILTFGSTWQTQYEYRSPVEIADKPTEKIDASLVCRDDQGGWQGLFVVYGDPLGQERTMRFAADAVEGPWRLVSDPEQPVLSFVNGSRLMHSVENPTPAAATGELAAC